MAGGRAVGRFQALLGFAGLIAVLWAGAVLFGYDPAGAVRGWYENLSGLADPKPRWTDSVGDPPDSVAVLDSAVIVRSGNTVEARSTADGRTLWHREAEWNTVAGESKAQIVLLGRKGAGVEAVDAATGDPRWKDAAATAVLGYRDLAVTMACPKAGNCTLTARAPADGAQRWSTQVAGVDKVSGADPSLADTRDVSDTYRAVTDVRRSAPRLIAVAGDKRVAGVSVGSGAGIAAVDAGGNRRVAAVGDRIVVAAATTDGDHCKYTVEGRDAASGSVVWRRDGYDLHTATGAGCDPRRDPIGGGPAMAATRADGRAVLLNSADGRELFVGVDGDSIVAMSSRNALVKGRDAERRHDVLRSLDLRTAAVRWEHRLPDQARVVLTESAALVVDQQAGRLVGYAPDSANTLIDIGTQADLVACGDDGMVLARGRTLGYVPFTGKP